MAKKRGRGGYRKASDLNEWINKAEKYLSSK